MALVPVVDRRAAQLAFGINQIPRLIDTGRAVYNHARTIYNRMARYRAPARRPNYRSLRVRRRPAPRRGRFNRSFLRRFNSKKRRFAGRRPHVIRTRRSQGRKTVGSQTIYLRHAAHWRDTFSQDNGGDFVPTTVKFANPADFLPTDDEMDKFQLCRFNTSAMKRLVGVHVFVKGVRYSETDAAVTVVNTSRPEDNSLYTYADRYDEDISKTVPYAHQMLKYGLPRKIIRGCAKYVSILQVPNLGCRNMFSGTLADLIALNRDQFWEAMNPVKYRDDHPGPNLDFRLMPEVQSCSKTGVTACMKFQICVTTKWKIRATKGPQ